MKTAFIYVNPLKCVPTIKAIHLIFENVKKCDALRFENLNVWKLQICASHVSAF